MRLSVTKNQARQWARFLSGGGINTVITYVVYLALNVFMSYQLAYMFAYVIGVVFSYWFNAVVVFKVSLSWKNFFSYPLVYVVQYCVSALGLGMMVEFIGMSETIAPLIVVMCMVPLTYMMSRYLLLRNKT